MTSIAVLPLAFKIKGSLHSEFLVLHLLFKIDRVFMIRSKSFSKKFNPVGIEPHNTDHHWLKAYTNRLETK